MNRLLAAFLGLVLAGSAAAFQPRTGLWWNPSESGSGYNIDVQDGTLVVTIFSYQTSGAAQWYLASGPLINDQHSFTGTLDTYAGGQCISCPYSGRPAITGSDGAISIAFATETSATVTLPGGRTTPIQPFNFGIGDPPDGLLGEWVFAYDVGGITQAHRFNLTSLQGPSSPSGNGMAIDPSRLAVCELQVSGTLAGLVICAQADSRGNLLSGMYFRFGLDEAYGGYTISPPTPSGTRYPMTGFKVRSKGGFARQAASPTSPKSTMGSAPALKTALSADVAPDTARPADIRALVDAIAGMSRRLVEE
jgi:hypothetical protein